MRISLEAIRWCICPGEVWSQVLGGAIIPFFLPSTGACPEGLSVEVSLKHLIVGGDPGSPGSMGGRQQEGNRYLPNRGKKIVIAFARSVLFPGELVPSVDPWDRLMGKQAHQGRSGLHQSLFESLDLEGTALAACLESYQDDEIAPRG